MPRTHLGLLTSPAFLFGLTLLLVNDAILKPAFHNAITGKLSDFAGLFVFPLFFIAFFARFRRSILLITVIGFIFWKSQASQPLIDWMNGWLHFPVARTVDFTDLIALIMVPLAGIYSRLDHPVPRSSFVTSGLALVSFFAFAATSSSYTSRYRNTEYAFTDSRTNLLSRIELLDEQDQTFNFRREYDGLNHLGPTKRPSDSGRRYVEFDTDVCDRGAQAEIELVERRQGTLIILERIRYSAGCDTVKDDKAKLLKSFEQAFITKLRVAATQPLPSSVIGRSINPCDEGNEQVPSKLEPRTSTTDPCAGLEHLPHCQ